jgi:hypothetical protein
VGFGFWCLGKTIAPLFKVLIGGTLV